MGRPAKLDKDRRKPVTLRLDPVSRERLESMAAASGRSLGKEIEARIVATMGFDAPGIQLVDKLGAGISELTKLNKKKRWHIDLTGWAAVAEYLAEGPIHDWRPNSEIDADFVNSACDPLLEVDELADELVRGLAKLGVSVSPERKIHGLLKLNNRTLERAAIDKIPDGELKSSAIDLHTQLANLDDEREDRARAFHKAMEPYVEAEESGRQLCRDYLHNEAQRQIDADELYNPFHLMRMFGNGA